MIYIVEVPHRMPAKCWVAINQQQAINAISESFIGKDDWSEITDFESAISVNARDLHMQFVFMSDAEAIEGLEDISGHQSDTARAALRKKLIYHGAIQEQDEAEDE